MTSGDEVFEGRLRKFLDTRRGEGGGSENLHTSIPTGGGAPEKIGPLASCC